MDEPERSVRRVQMGRSVQPLVAAAGPGASGGVEDGYWYFLSGAPSPDANIVLVLEPEALGPALGVTRASELSVMVMVAPSAAGAAPGDGWTHVGSMPLMAADLGAIPLAVDAWVRTAGAGDRGDLGAILAEAYDMDRSVADRFTAVAGGAVPGLHFWLLEEGSEARSVVLSSIVGDAVCIWCMGTPKRLRPPGLRPVAPRPCAARGHPGRRHHGSARGHPGGSTALRVHGVVGGRALGAVPRLAVRPVRPVGLSHGGGDR